MVLKPGAAISGLVKDRAGNGIPGYRLAARASTGAPGPMGPLGGTMTEEPTGPDGSFLIEGGSTPARPTSSSSWARPAWGPASPES